MSLEKKKYAACVILYNPTIEEIKKINVLTKIFNQTYIYDNSNEDNYEYINSNVLNKRFTYFFNGQNEGISIGVNNVVEIAWKESIDIILVLDQDSQFSEAMISASINYIDSNPGYAMYAPKILFKKTNNYLIDDNKIGTEIDFCITSGSFIKIDTFRKLKGYDENLFIDGVDRDYCLNLKNNNEKICQIPNVFLYQTLGSGEKNFFGVFPHSGLRNYYIYRNRLYILDKYPTIFTEKKKIKSKYLSILKQLGSILFFEENKVNKFKFIYKGHKDFKNKIFGRYKGY